MDLERDNWTVIINYTWGPHSNSRENLNLSVELCNMIGQSSKLNTLIECPTFSELCKLGPTITHAIVLNLKLRYTIEYIYFTFK